MIDSIWHWLRLMARNWQTLTTFIVSSFFLVAAFSFLLTSVYRALEIPEDWQGIVSTITLQDASLWLRGFVFGALGIGGVVISFAWLGKSLLQPYGENRSAAIAKNIESYYKRNSGPNIVLIGGGIGTAQLIRGMKKHAGRLSVVVHMTDDGGSAGRLRRYLGTPAFGDIVSNIVALSDREETLKEMLLYRFKGDRYGGDGEIGGHKLGNLLFAALADITGDLNRAIEEASRVFSVRGKVLPVALEPVFLHARTADGIEVEGEENIDLGKYEGEKVLDQIWYEPADGKVNPKVLEAITKADLVILGPGDLYTSILANLIFKDLTKALEQSSAMKAYILNVANKPFETRGYELQDFIDAFARHRAEKTFSHIFVNSNHGIPIPATPEYEGYSYVQYDREKMRSQGYQVVEGDYLERFMGGVEGKGVSIYHDSEKIARAILESYQEFRKKLKLRTREQKAVGSRLSLLRKREI